MWEEKTTSSVSLEGKQMLKNFKTLISATLTIVFALGVFFTVGVNNAKAISLQGDNGQYLSRIRRGAIDSIEAAKPQLDPPFTSFNLVKLPDGKVAFKADNGLYLSRIRRGAIDPVEAAKTDIDVFSQFTLLAQQAPQPPSRGITTLYVTPEQQAEGVNVYKNILKYDVAIPNLDLSAMLPENLSDFPAAYQPFLEQGRKNNGINGSFTEGWFDFQGATAVTPGTNTLFTINAPLNDRIYSVVAGKPSSQCPLKIEETAIAFFDNVKAAESKANELDANGYLVYVSPSDNLTIKAFSQLFYDQHTGKKKTNSACFLVSGATEQVTTDFRQIFPLLPPALQQPARQAPFQYFPRTGNFIYLVNARKTLTPRS